MTQVLNNAVLVNGLRDDFEQTYADARARMGDSRIADFVDLGVPATNRQHDFAFYESAPHAAFWKRGMPIPQGAFGAVSFQVPVFETGIKIEWSKFDREDEQVGNLLTQARQAGASFARVAEDQAFDILNNTPTILPAIPLAPDGAALFATTAGGAARFGATNGNLLTGNGVATSAAIRQDYYAGISQFKQFLDTKGKRLFRPDQVDQGVVVVYSTDNEQVFEEAFLQQRQGTVLGTDAGTTPTNILLDTNRKVRLMSTNQLSGADWFMFMVDTPKKPLFELMRKSPLELAALEGDNNSDRNRNNALESTQFEMRSGMGISTPYGAMKINN